MDLGIQALNDALQNEEVDADTNDVDANNVELPPENELSSRSPLKKTLVLDSDEERIAALVGDNDEEGEGDNDNEVDEEDEEDDAQVEENENEGLDDAEETGGWLKKNERDNNFFEDNDVCFFFPFSLSLFD